MNLSHTTNPANPAPSFNPSKPSKPSKPSFNPSKPNKPSEPNKPSKPNEPSNEPSIEPPTVPDDNESDDPFRSLGRVPNRPVRTTTVLTDAQNDRAYFFPVSYESLPQPARREDDGEDGDEQFRPNGRMPSRAGKPTTKLTEAQMEKARMVAASYELDHIVNTQLQNEGGDFGETVLDVMETHGQEALQEVGLGAWTLDSDLSTEQYIVLEKGEDVQVVFRGRAGDNPIDNQHVLDSFKGKARDYSELDELFQELRATRPDAKIAVSSYSNGGPKGMYMAEKYGLDHYTIDPVLGPKEVALMKNRTTSSGRLQIATTSRHAIASGAGTTAHEVLTGRTPANTEILTVEPFKLETSNPLELAIDAHDLHHYSGLDLYNAPIPESERVPTSLLNRNLAGGVVAGVVPAALASAAVEGIAPGQGKEAKIAETAGGAAILGQIISPIVGAGSAAAAEVALPLYASMEAADKTGVLADKILPDDLQGVPREVIKGGASGAAGGATFGAAAAAQEAVVSTATSALTTGAATTEAGVELTTLGEVAATVAAETAVEEVGIEAAIAAGAAAGGMATSELGPLAIGGAVIGALAGLAIGLSKGRHPHEQLSQAQIDTNYAESVLKLASENGSSDHFEEYVTDLLQRQTRGNTNSSEDATIALFLSERHTNPGSLTPNIEQMLDSYQEMKTRQARQNQVQIEQNERIRRIHVQNSEQEALQELINMEATGDYDSKRQAHLDELRQQYNQGELPEHLNAVFENRTKFSTIPEHTADQHEPAGLAGAVYSPNTLGIKPPSADFSDLAVGADESTVVEHEGS